MADLADSEKIRVLYDIEAIRNLKYKYWRCNDMKLMEQMEECFTEDAVADYGPGIYLEGRDAIVDFLKQNVGREDLVSIHQGFNPEIEITSEVTARGRWPFYNYMDYSGVNTVMKIWATYDDEYVKESAGWKIKATKVSYRLNKTVTSSQGLGTGKDSG